MAEEELLRKLYAQFIRLSKEKWQTLLNAHTQQEFKKGKILSKPGELVQEVHFIISGGIRMYYVKNNREYTCSFCFEGSYLGDYKSMLTSQPSRLYVEAIEDTVVYSLSKENMEELYHHSPEFIQFGKRFAEFLFTEITSRNESFLFETPEERYIQIMDEYPQLIQRIPQYMLASYIGVTPETISRIRKRISIHS
jgi:CRP-like cAMP-binding protein